MNTEVRSGYSTKFIFMRRYLILGTTFVFLALKFDIFVLIISSFAEVYLSCASLHSLDNEVSMILSVDD